MAQETYKKKKLKCQKYKCEELRDLNLLEKEGEPLENLKQNRGKKSEDLFKTVQSDMVLTLKSDQRTLESFSKASSQSFRTKSSTSSDFNSPPKIFFEKHL